MLGYVRTPQRVDAMCELSDPLKSSSVILAITWTESAYGLPSFRMRTVVPQGALRQCDTSTTSAHCFVAFVMCFG
jgi:hypothetical protein